MSGPELSVVIPTCNRPRVLEQTLAALQAQRCEPASAQIIVVVDGGDAASVRVVEAAARTGPFEIQVLARRRGGQGAARNAGIERAAGRIVVMLDDDIVAVPDLLLCHARHHTGREDTVVTGALPVHITDPEPAHQRALREWWDRVMQEWSMPAHRPTFRDFVTGNVSVPRSRLLEIGGFDADFTGYGREDYELGYRLLRAGLRFVHEPCARGLHLYSKPLPEWLRQFHAQGRADVIFCRKHPDLAGEVMMLSPFPTIPWFPPLIRASEHLTTRLNRRGGGLWKRSAALVQAAHYWRGVREEATGAELRMLVQTQLDALRSRYGKAGLTRLTLARLGGWI